MTEPEKNETEVLVAKIKVNKVRSVITECLEKTQEDFEDYLCYEKYGAKKFKNGKYTLDADDKEMQRRLQNKNFTTALKSLLQEPQEALPILESLSTTDSEEEVRSWAKALLSRI
ncbi:MAG: hypothetical protein KGD59_10820 [Candidatus Heimdallarchaeota archaeon]|nr:hypothetical protein [Candidatus Heimdallarchaeota archaeon]MBY8995032.1 hypothetical protein [Candidatus Heimdallarchaeota archaeon]